MEIVVLGAGGGVGREAVHAAEEAGLRVRAGSRSGQQVGAAALAVAVDVRDGDALARAVEGADAVLWCVGVTKTSGPDVGRTGMAHLVRAAAASGPTRVVCVSGAGITVPGEEKSWGARAVSALTRRLARDLVLDKQAEYEILAASDLRWTIVRPPRLVDGAATGQWQLTERAPGPTAAPVRRADVAAAMLAFARDGDRVGEAPFIVGR